MLKLNKCHVQSCSTQDVDQPEAADAFLSIGDRSAGVVAPPSQLQDPQPCPNFPSKTWPYVSGLDWLGTRSSQIWHSQPSSKAKIRAKILSRVPLCNQVFKKLPLTVAHSLTAREGYKAMTGPLRAPQVCGNKQRQHLKFLNDGHLTHTLDFLNEVRGNLFTEETQHSAIFSIDHSTYTAIPRLIKSIYVNMQVSGQGTSNFSGGVVGQKVLYAGQSSDGLWMCFDTSRIKFRGLPPKSCPLAKNQTAPQLLTITPLQNSFLWGRTLCYHTTLWRCRLYLQLRTSLPQTSWSQTAHLKPYIHCRKEVVKMLKKGVMIKSVCLLVAPAATEKKSSK